VIPPEVIPTEHRVAAESAFDAAATEHPERTSAPRVIHPYLEPGEEMVLVDFDEEPAVFDEDPEEHRDDLADDDDDDEILDLFDDQPTDEEDAASGTTPELLTTDRDEPVDQRNCSVDEELEISHEIPVVAERVDAESIAREGPDREGGWILDAFEAWKQLMAAEPGVHGGQAVVEVDERAGVDDDLDEHGRDAVVVACPPDAAVCDLEVCVGAPEPAAEPHEPDQRAPAPSVSQISVRTERKKARHKKQSRRQKERSSRKATRDAEKAAKSSTRTAMKSAS
jgi:hypothetical protein